MPSLTSESLSSTVPLPPPAGRIVPISLRDPFHIHGTNGDNMIDLRGLDPGAEWYFSVHAGSGNDTVHGSAFADRIDGEGADDTLYGWDGDDTLIGGAGVDTLMGGAGNDSLFGGSQDDMLFGSIGSDYLHGGDGVDFLRGQEGNDVLQGGRSADILIGGAGADRFVYAAADLVWEPRATPVTFFYAFCDQIRDFDIRGGDRIDLSALLDGATNFSGATAHQAIAQGYVYFVQWGMPGDADFCTIVHVDRDGGAHAVNTYEDLVVAKVMGVAAHELTAASFIV